MATESEISRRGFLKTAGVAAAGAAAVGGGVASRTGALVGHGIRENVEEMRPGTNGQELKVQAHRTLGRTGFQVSDIGFGAGSLTNSNVLAVGLDMGINYVDTAEHYMNGQSELAIGRVLRGRDRSSIFLTTKLNLSFGGAGSKEDLKGRFHACLDRLQTDYADCLMIHMTPRVEEVKDEEFHAAYQELKAEGRVRYLGLSNHGTEHSVWGRIESPMEQVIGAAAEDGRFDVALFVYNFLQKDQGQRIIDACQARNMGVTLMKTNPVAVVSQVVESSEASRARGRLSESRERLVRDYEEWAQAAEEFKERHGLRSAGEVRDAAIKFCLANTGVHTVCPTMNTFDELEAFVALSGQALSSADTPMLASYHQLLGPYYCRHACGICEPSCPHQVPINTISRYGHYFNAQSRQKQAIQKYAKLPGPRAELCADCDGHCENACPYGVRARTLLSRAHDILTLA
ncbi:MAG: aldo/keto reductase [Gemmatimonadota bacterium]|jgi:predicted aldo/keto reductase-like oxidoreductase